MGTLHHLRTGRVIDDGAVVSPGATADPWETGIGRALRPFVRTHPRSTSEHVDASDGRILLDHLLAARGDGFWGESALRQITPLFVHDRFTGRGDDGRMGSRPAQGNREFIRGKVDRLEPRLAKRLIADPLEAFERAVRASHATRDDIPRSRNDESYVAALCALFVAIIYLGHHQIPPHAPVEDRPRPPAPVVRPRDDSGPSRFRK